MKISVVIPTYNSARVIRHTLDSVLRQTAQADEILVLDDGSKDETLSVLEAYKPRVTVFQQTNQGVAAARNELCKRASGDLIAFLDHDDLWHPRYLEIQSQRFIERPKAAGFFTKHDNFSGHGDFDWSKLALDFGAKPEIIPPAQFVSRYNSSTGTFYSMSFCCVPKAVLSQMGKPFAEEVSGVDDCYLCNLLPFFGPAVLTPAQLVAYRVTSGAQSVNHLKNFRQVVRTFELLESRYRESSDPALWKEFQSAFAGKLRRYGKTLMGAGQIAEARLQFRRAVRACANPKSFAKSFSLLCASYMPSRFQPHWPASQRASQAHA